MRAAVRLAPLLALLLVVCADPGAYARNLAANTSRMLVPVVPVLVWFLAQGVGRRRDWGTP